MVAAFLARGGRVHKIPDAVPNTDGDVLAYLRRRHIKVEPVPAKEGEVERKYLYGGETLNLKDLVKVANRERRRQRMIPFQL